MCIRDRLESLQWGRDVFLPYLEQHKTLTPEDEKLFAEIMATENDWFRVPEDKNTSLAAVSYTHLYSYRFGSALTLPPLQSLTVSLT